jgi:hypothetical protein
MILKVEDYFSIRYYMRKLLSEAKTEATQKLYL